MHKKSVASLAVFMSTVAAQAIVGPLPSSGAAEKVSPKPTVYCLQSWELPDKSLAVGSCDESEQNDIFQLPKLENGCAEGQVAMTVYANAITIAACPTMVQL